MRVIFVCLLGFLMSSCAFKTSANKSIEEVDWLLSSEWIYALKINGPKYNNQEILRPAGIEQFIMGVTLPTAGGLAKKLHCVYYSVGYKEKKSTLNVLEFKNIEECPESSLASKAETEGERYIFIEGVDKFKINFQAFKLHLSFTYQNKNAQINIDLPNVNNGVIHQKYQSLTTVSLFSGMKFLRLTDESFDFARNKNLGKLSDRFSSGTAIRCEQVNKDCETQGENRCESCRYGWYEVVDFQCPQGGSKFCGQNHCGEKNEPACPRGSKVVALEDSGICQSDLEPILNSDKILVCQ